MADIVNLNRFKKTKSKADKAKTAEKNRVKFGRTKADKARDADQRERSQRDLDGKEIPKNSDD